MLRRRFTLAAFAFALPPMQAAGDIKLTREITRSADPHLLAEWKAVVTHTHKIRSGEIAFDEANRKLVEWCRRLGISAVGVGSPWEPVSEAAYQRFEGPDRNLYYSGKIDPASVMNRREIARAFEDLNGLAGGRTLFYMDNETPKCRLGHHWWFGYTYDVPAWHDYSQDRPIQYWENDPEVEINPLTGQPQRRRSLLEITAVQRKAGAIGVFAHPTSWWIQDGRFVTNIASEVPLFLYADGYLDGITVMGYDACHRAYQALWFRLLDTGAVVPGFAETDFSLDSQQVLDGDKAFMNYMHVPGPITERGIVDAARRGASFLSTGAFLTTSVDGAPMGGIVRTGATKVHRLRIEAYPRPGESRFSRIDVIGRNGRVLTSKTNFTGGVLEYSFGGRSTPDYIVVRAFGEHDDPDAKVQKSIAHMALSNPVYLHPDGFRFEPVHTSANIEISAESEWIGGTLAFQTASGERLESRPIKVGTVHALVPASARVQLTKPGRETRTFYIAMENPGVQRLLAYLYTGEFRKDYPGIAGGNVPPGAFHLEEMRAALREFNYSIR